MPNRRKSDRIHRLAGTLRPDRHGQAADRPPAPTAGIGRPPAYFDAPLRKVWRELATAAPWLTEADRHAMELACRAVGALRSTTSPPPALLSQVGRALDRIALSTSSRGESPGVRDRQRKAAPGGPWDGLELRRKATS